MSTSQSNRQRKVTKTVTMKTKHNPPIVIDSHLEDVSVIAMSAYVQDFRNRMYINNVELKKLWEDHVNVYHTVKPYFVKAIDKVKELQSN